MENELLRVENLNVSIRTYRGEVQAVRGISFSIMPGEIFSIVGESGCGKSVTAQTLMKLNPSPPAMIRGGKILFEGKDLVPLKEKEMRRIRGRDISMIFQDPMTSLNPSKKVGKQIEEALRVHRQASDENVWEKVIELLKLVGIPSPEVRAKQYPHEFSGGMRQRAMIAMGLACSPKLLIADEPTTALDVTIQAQILELMKETKEKTGNAIILITHDLGVVANMADKVAVMYAGKILEMASCDELFEHPTHPYTQQLLAAKPKLNQNREEKLVSIEGMPPSLLEPPKGCPFAPRCCHCMERCREQMPNETIVGENHMACCFLCGDGETKTGEEKV